MKIRQKIILSLLFIGLIPMIAVGIFAYMSASNDLLLKATDQLNSTAIKQSERINAIVQREQEVATQIANQYDLRVALAAYTMTPNVANRQQLSTLLQNAGVGNTTLQYIRLYDATNTVIATSVTDTTTGDAIAKIITPGDGNVNDARVVKDPRDGSLKVEISTKINPQATLSTVFRADDLLAVVQDYTGLDTTGETLVMTKGEVSLFPLRFNTEGALSVSLSSLNAENSTPGAYETGADYRGTQVLYVSQRPVGLNNWLVVAKIDRSEALASTTSLRTTLIWMLFVAGILITGIALIFTSFFTRPILHMVRVAKRIGNGDFTAVSGLKRRDELGVLSTNLDAMKDNLSHLIGGIESQRERLEVILNTTTEGIFAIDESAKVLLANRSAEKLVDGTAKDVLGRTMNEIFDWHKGTQPFAVDYQKPGVTTYTELEFTDKQNTRRFVKMIVAQVHEELQAGRTHAIVTIHDETSSRELEAMKTDFVSMAAHELRTPLTAVRGYLEMAALKEQQHELDGGIYVDKALKNVNELSGLINNLLDVTRIERGTLVLEMDRMDFAECIGHAVDDAHFLATDRTINLSYDGPKNGKFVVGDPIAVREIVNNLLSNAIKYTRPGGAVSVHFSESDAGYSVSVKDTGIGIAKEAQKYLFNKFYRVHGGLESGSNGTGLGLYIAQSIAQRHNGVITVMSEEGKGSTFTFTLPVFTDARYDEVRAQKDKNNGMIRRKRGWVTKNIAR